MTARSLRVALAAAALALTLPACGTGAEPFEHEQTARTVAPVVYGTDDRQDVYAHPTEALRTLAQQSIAAMISARAVDTSDPSNVRLAGTTLQSALNLCSDQRFLNDPTPGSCSGTLIGPDLVITAGHCIEDAADCAGVRWVFNFYRDTETTLHPLTSDDVFSCREIVLHRNATVNGRRLDFTIARLDRPAAPRFTPAPVRRGAAPLTRGQSLTVIGFPSGIPAKIDSGGAALDGRASTTDYFTSTVDTFAGNSGSGIFDTETRELVGILSAGETDYERRGTCNVVNVCSSGCSGEIATYAYNAIALLCAATPTDPLCTGLGTICGNGACDAGEDPANCPSDCVPPPPAAWTCEASRYATGGACDCMCGAYDPDCATPRATVVGCMTGQGCNEQSMCVAVRRSPTSWTCEDALYNDRVSCECGCGAPDPDCRRNLPVRGCGEGQQCSRGVCVGEITGDAGSGGGDASSADAGIVGDAGAPPGMGGCSCTTTPGAPTTRAPWAAVLLCAAGAATRVRRRRASRG